MSIDVGKLLKDAERRFAAGGAGSGFDLAGLFKSGSVLEQLLIWGVVNQLAAAVLAPELEEVQRGVRSVLQSVPLSPPDLADMVVRNIVGQSDAEAYAKQSGVASSDFARLVHSAGTPPSPQELVAALRRGIIPHDGTGPNATSFEQGIAEGRTYNKWRPVLEALADVPLDPAVAVDAVVEGQIPYDQGAHEAFLNGINADRFRIQVNTRGNPPSPGELAELLKRKLIPLEGVGPDQTSFQQGIFEGATKDKWWTLFAALADYIPPPRTVTAMVREGSLTDDQALAFYQQAGLSQDLAAAYLTSAHHQKTTAERDLTVATIKALYQDRLITRPQATEMLMLLKYSQQDAAYLEDLWDFEAFQSKVRAAIARVHSLYVAHKIDGAEAGTALDQLGVPAEGRDELVTVWNLERAVNVPQLTRAEIVDAWYWSILTDAEADQRLETLGWTAEEAAILRGIRAHGKERPTPAA